MADESDLAAGALRALRPTLPSAPERPPPQDAPDPSVWAKLATASSATEARMGRDPEFWSVMGPVMQSAGVPAAGLIPDPETGTTGRLATPYERAVMLAQWFGNALPFRGGTGGLVPRATAVTKAPAEVEVPEAAVQGWWGQPNRAAPGLTNFEAKLADEHGIPPSEAYDWWRQGGPKTVPPVTATTPTTAPTTFTTAKGSRYLLHPDGTTTRNKAPRPEHPGDAGLQPRSARTWFVTEEDVGKLSEVTVRGGPRRQVGTLKDGRIGVQYLEGKDAGKFESRTVVSPSSTPEPGLFPVEIWPNQSIHFGNKITTVQRGSGPPLTPPLPKELP